MYTLAWGTMSFVGFMFMASAFSVYGYLWWNNYKAGEVNMFWWNEKKYKAELSLLFLTGVSFLSYLPLLLTDNYWFLLVGVCPYILFFGGNVCLYGLFFILKSITSKEVK